MFSGIISIFEYIGIIAFSVSGTMIAIKQRMDLFGCLFLGATTALGGGAFRDIILGRLPPGMFMHYEYLLLAVCSSLLVFVPAYLFKKKYPTKVELIETVNNLFDAVGLGIFTVNGVQISLSQGYGENMVLCVFLGMMTGVGGGLLRDIISNEIPVIFRKHIYAIASLTGAICYFVLHKLQVSGILSTSLGVLVIFSLRLMATRYKWNLPKVI